MTTRFADLEPGDVYDCGTISVTREEILTFAHRFDPLPIHVDAAAAEDGPFGEIVASGIHTFGLSQVPAVETLFGDSDLIASLGISDMTFARPVYAGDELHVTVEVLDRRVSEGNARRGVISTLRTAETDNGVVLELTNNTLWRR
jgi:acyl dehydratase